MISVWKNGVWWFDFPAQNENNVQAMLQRKNISGQCVMLPKGVLPKVGKVTVIAPTPNVIKEPEPEAIHLKAVVAPPVKKAPTKKTR